MVSKKIPNSNIDVVYVGSLVQSSLGHCAEKRYFWACSYGRYVTLIVLVRSESDFVGCSERPKYRYEGGNIQFHTAGGDENVSMVGINHNFNLNPIAHSRALTYIAQTTVSD